jgi:NADP-dependent 3-hydroxy acid dehydrogenase YdfG
MDLKDKVAIITGAGSGIGQAVARNLNEVGVKFVITAWRTDWLEKFAKELHAAVPVPGDITDPFIPQKLLDKTLQAFDRWDIVLNNAGIVRVGTIDEVDINGICQMVRVNVEAAFRMAYVVLKHFKSTGSGFLLNVSSVVGTKVRPTAGAYAGTKNAIEALTESLSMELAKTKIGVACIESGLVETELHREWKVPLKESLDVPMPLQPEDIARVTRFMLEQPDHVRIPRILILSTDQSL